MLVTAAYADGSEETLTWEALGGISGGVSSARLSLISVTDSVFTLTTTDTLVSLKLEALHGEAVFDIIKGIKDGTRGDTLGTRIGFPYEEVGGDL